MFINFKKLLCFPFLGRVCFLVAAVAAAALSAQVSFKEVIYA